MIEQVALAIFLSQYPARDDGPEPSSMEFWPDRLSELVSGPPFDADGYREMARAALEATSKHLVECASLHKEQAYYAAIDEIQEALGKVDA